MDVVSPQTSVGFVANEAVPFSLAPSLTETGMVVFCESFSHRRRALYWSGGAVAGCAIVGLLVLMLGVGATTSVRLAVLGVSSGAALALAVYLLVLGQRCEPVECHLHPDGSADLYIETDHLHAKRTRVMLAPIKVSLLWGIPLYWEGWCVGVWVQDKHMLLACCSSRDEAAQYLGTLPSSVGKKVELSERTLTGYGMLKVL